MTIKAQNPAGENIYQYFLPIKFKSNEQNYNFISTLIVESYAVKGLSYTLTAGYNDAGDNDAYAEIGGQSQWETAHQTITLAEDYVIKSEAEKQWWINNSNLKVDDSGNLTAPITLSRKAAKKVTV